MFTLAHPVHRYAIAITTTNIRNNTTFILQLRVLFFFHTAALPMLFSAQNNYTLPTLHLQTHLAPFKHLGIQHSPHMQMVQFNGEQYCPLLVFYCATFVCYVRHAGNISIRLFVNV